ncbi:fibronectin-binding protein A-like [Schistocerca gregaria]|uniref:fibronectin-binding protein A-like n=1 Tax=Schistocerca gregaria TaxID=7010 RepID=UPI00211E4213|nr:fibronectin-binding protein A-like [Schistocerca gregaria]
MAEDSNNSDERSLEEVTKEIVNQKIEGAKLGEESKRKMFNEEMEETESDEEMEETELDEEMEETELDEEVEGGMLGEEGIESKSDVGEVEVEGGKMGKMREKQADNEDVLEASKKIKNKDKAGEKLKKNSKKGKEQRLKKDRETPEKDKKEPNEFKLDRRKRGSNVVICRHRELNSRNDKTVEKVNDLPEEPSTASIEGSLVPASENNGGLSEVLPTTSTGDALPSEVTGSPMSPPSFMPPPPSFTPLPPSKSVQASPSERRLMKPPFDELPLPPEDPVVVSELTGRTSPFCKALVNFGKANAPRHFQAREDLLSIRNGDILVVTGKVNDKWYQGQLGDQLGLFPIDLSTDVDENEVKRFIAQSMQRKKNLVSKESRQELQQKMKDLTAAAENGDKCIQDINEEIKELTIEAHRRRKKLRVKLMSEYNNVLPPSYYDIPLQEYIFHTSLDTVLTILEIRGMNDNFKNVLAAFVETSTDFAQEFKKHLAVDPRTKGNIEKAIAYSQQVQKCLMDELSNIPTELLNQCVNKLSSFCIQFQRALLSSNSTNTSSKAEGG